MFISFTGGGEPKAKSDCFRKSTFYILTAVLVVLMIVTLVIGAVLFFKLRSVTPSNSPLTPQ